MTPPAADGPVDVVVMNPELNEAGFLVPGANAQTGAFALPRTCGFHDHNDGTNPAWMGRIIIR
jgi:hypothetical protein